MLLVLDGVAVELKREEVQALKAWHCSVGDRVVSSDEPEYIEVYTSDGEGVSLAGHYIEAVAGYPIETWKSRAQEILKREFNPEMDLVKYTGMGHKEVKVSYPRKRSVAEEFETFARRTPRFVAYNFSIEERLTVTHAGSCNSGKGGQHTHRLVVRADVHTLLGLRRKLRWNRARISRVLHTMAKNIHAGSAEHPQRKGSKRYGTPENVAGTFYENIASRFAREMGRGMSATTSIVVSVMDRGSTQAVVEWRGVR